MSRLGPKKNCFSKIYLEIWQIPYLKLASITNTPKIPRNFFPPINFRRAKPKNQKKTPTQTPGKTANPKMLAKAQSFNYYCY